ncbi:polysaccharide biosynthesis protein [Halobacillus shinanisalinarum]|uniref:Polysaccharide biosynthesis protein n=1 Tax=Halobacillus shinanisalinarum TaxID=2932258 RepID=A0ABY4H1K8_9BACI|nr:polysaccharide biosynthesis protein [Halobacillus shinanisalinarum]UOQ94186.1 polysaccharide biosynthesis protein [Halobacillus shinanisalinarum]
MSKILKGTMILTVASFLSKFLGMIYTVPFEEMVGPDGMELYFYAYTPYNILLSLSTLGVPLAVSKFVSKYNSLEDYQTGREMLRSGMLLMGFTGIVAFLITFLGAEQIAIHSLSDEATNTKVAEVTIVIRMISFALLIIPLMSIIRGFFQGNDSMAPTGISQVIEQIVRIIFLLVSVYVVLNVLGGELSTAIGFSTFAAFIGGVASLIVLAVFWKKRKPHLDKLVEQQEFTYDISRKSMYKELLGYAGPFVLVGIATPLYQLIDQFTFKQAMTVAGLGDNSGVALSAIHVLSHKLVIIPVTLGIGLSLALLPAITKSYTKNYMGQLNHQINQALQIIALLILPAVVGLSVLANEAYGAFYGVDKVSYFGDFLRWYAPVGLFFALYTVTSSILQGINRQNFAVVSLGSGLAIKLLTNSWFIVMFGAKGSIISTGLAVLVAVALNLWRIHRAIDFSFKQVYKRSLLIIIVTTIMAAVVFLIKWAIGLLWDPLDSRLAALFILMLSAGIGGIVYIWMAYQTTLLERILGGRVRILDKFLRRGQRG